jgi:hypothetical protein
MAFRLLCAALPFRPHERPRARPLLTPVRRSWGASVIGMTNATEAKLVRAERKRRAAPPAIAHLRPRARVGQAREAEISFATVVRSQAPSLRLLRTAR